MRRLRHLFQDLPRHLLVAGVTAEFNRNILRVMNARLGADFDVAAFEHVAFYEPFRQWIEMRLRATRPTAVHIPEAGVERAFARGDEIRTEISASTRASVSRACWRGPGYRSRPGTRTRAPNSL